MVLFMSTSVEVVDLPILAIDMELIRVKHPSWLDFVGGGYSNEFITIFIPPNKC